MSRKTSIPFEQIRTLDNEIPDSVDLSKKDFQQRMNNPEIRKYIEKYEKANKQYKKDKFRKRIKRIVKIVWKILKPTLLFGSGIASTLLAQYLMKLLDLT